VPGHTRLVDTHCHVDLFPEPRTLVAQLEAARLYTIAVTNAPSVFPVTARLVARCRYVRAAVGLHPELAADRGAELPLFWDALRSTRYVGEVGLDYAAGTRDARRRQRAVFEQILTRCDELGDRVLTVHSRRAADDVINMVGPRFRGTVVLHWYSGSSGALERALDAGCYLSANAAMARSDRSLGLLACAPKHRVLLESDGPFVAVEGRPSTPFDLSAVVFAIARLWGASVEATGAQLFANARALLTGGNVGPGP
jgi:TatD DNase family protein